MPYTDRYLSAHGVIGLAGRQLKLYHVTALDAGIEDPVSKAAIEMLPDLLPAPDGTTPPASFVILHRGAATGSYVVAYSWVWDNVIECHSAVAGIPFLGCPDENPEHFTRLERPWFGCVWELAQLEHERAAWIRHVLTPEVPDLDAYLADFRPDGTTQVADQVSWSA